MSAKQLSKISCSFTEPFRLLLFKKQLHHLIKKIVEAFNFYGFCLSKCIVGYCIINKLSEFIKHGLVSAPMELLKIQDSQELTDL